MTDDELAMVYVDGELDALAAKRFEKRMAEAPEIAAAVEAHQALRTTLECGFAFVAEEPLPERLTSLLQTSVVEIHPKARFAGYWRAATAMAACLVAGVMIGQFWQPAPGVSGAPLVASGALAKSLDRQLAGAEAPTRVLASFRDTEGHYCRVFQGAAISGIACHESAGWALRQTQSSSPAGTTDYSQAGSTAPALLAAAQAMMAGDPLDPAAEQAAQARGWQE
jgi:hypothetical protein